MSQRQELPMVGAAVGSDTGASGRRMAVRLLVVIALGAAFAHNAAVTWERWGDLIIDTGRELDTPKQLAEGKTLYRDVRYWYGPLAPYWHALLYRAFGVRLAVLTTAGLGLAGVMAWVSYRILRLAVGRVAAAAGAAVVLYVPVFGLYQFPNIFNFVLPYSYPAVYGMVLASGSVYLLMRYLRSRRAWEFFSACVLLGLTGLCKLEPLFAALVGHGAFVLVCLRRGELNWRRFAVGYGAAFGIVAAVIGGFRAAAGLGLWRENLFIPGNVSLSKFLLEHSGMDEPLKNVGYAALSLALLAACAALGAGGAAVEGRTSSRGSRIAMWAAFSLVIVVMVGLLGVTHVLAGLPALLIAALIWLGVGLLRRGGRESDGVIVLLAFGLAAMLRMGLACSAVHYGFYLVIPGLLGLVVVVFELGPAALRRRSGERRWSPMVCGVALLAGLGLLHYRDRAAITAFMYPRPSELMVRGPRGRMMIGAIYLGAGDRAVSFLSTRPRGTKVVVLPEGSAITFLSGCDNPLGVHTYLPPDFSGSYDDAGIVARVSAANPDYVLFDSRDVREYGKTAFGTDYGIPLAEWASERYVPIAEYLSERRGFGIRVLERR